jgi:hypothetical protein
VLAPDCVATVGATSLIAQDNDSPLFRCTKDYWRNGHFRKCPPCIAPTNSSRNKYPHWIYRHTKVLPRLRASRRVRARQSIWKPA